MGVIKFEYGFESHEPVRYTIEQIEAGLDFSKTGKPIYRRQYIGMEDINGVEIYEGDRFYDEGVVFVQYCEEEAKYVAAWQGMKEYDTPVNMSAYVKSDIEIFGNIHQSNVLAGK